MQDEFSTDEGFVEISESLAEMIKYIANEPSLGLFYIQKHNQSAVPNVINIKDNVKAKSHETTLHTEDLEDSISIVRSMKECGPSIADEMIGDIKKSLLTLKTKQPKRGLIHNPTSDFQTAGIGSSSVEKYFSSQGSGERSRSYLSTVFQSSKQDASGFKWPKFDLKRETLDHPNPPFSVISAGAGPALQGIEADTLPLSCPPVDESRQEGDAENEINKLDQNVLSISANYDDFKAGKEAQLEKWLEGTGSKLDILKGGSAESS